MNDLNFCQLQDAEMQDEGGNQWTWYLVVEPFSATILFLPDWSRKFARVDIKV